MSVEFKQELNLTYEFGSHQHLVDLQNYGASSPKKRETIDKRRDLYINAKEHEHFIVSWRRRNQQWRLKKNVL